MSATTIADAVRSGRTTAAETIRDHLARIGELDPELRAFATVRRDEALAEAAVVDQRDDRGSLPLAGVPVAIKANVALDDELVRRLRDAGAVVVGTTRMPELAIWPFTEFESEEPVLNPHVRSLTCGGSSGGSAVAVAAGMAALALGSDGGGSLRVPAACCGVVGLKPSAGVVPIAGGASAHWGGLTQWGPLAAHAADAALMLDVLAGERRYRDVGPAGPLRVAVSVKAPMLGARIQRECADATRAVAAALRHAGHAVTEASPPYPSDLGPRFSRRWLTGIAEDARGLDPASLESRTRKLAAAGRRLDRLDLGAPSPDRKVASRMARWFEDYDVLLTPTLADAAVPVGRWRGKGWIRTTLGVGNWLLTTPWNLVGFPAASIPAGVGAAGGPIGVQLVGLPGSDALLLSVARAVEELRAA